MAFDGTPHKDAPWVKPVTSHPGAAASADVLAASLAGAYAYARRAHNQIGALTYRWTFESLTSSTIGVWSTSIVEIGQIEGYVPSWAERIRAEVSFVQTQSQDADAVCRVRTASDTGTSSTISLDQAASPEVGRVVGPFGSRLANAYSYTTSRITSVVDLNATTLDADVLVSVDLHARSPDSSQAVNVYPLAVSVWWE